MTSEFGRQSESLYRLSVWATLLRKSARDCETAFRSVVLIMKSDDGVVRNIPSGLCYRMLLQAYGLPITIPSAQFPELTLDNIMLKMKVDKKNVGTLYPSSSV